MHYCALVSDIFSSIDLTIDVFYTRGNTDCGISVTFQFTEGSFGYQEICRFESVSLRLGTVLKGLVCALEKIFGDSCK